MVSETRFICGFCDAPMHPEALFGDGDEIVCDGCGWSFILHPAPQQQDPSSARQVSEGQQEPEGDGWDARRRAQVTPEETQEAVDRLRTRVDPERGVCPKCGSPAMLEPITRGGRPQIALCTNEACGWDGWIPDRAEAQQEPEGDGWEPTLEDEASFLSGVNDHLQARQRGEPHDTKLSAYQAGLRAVFHRLRARVQPRRVSDEALKHALYLYEDELTRFGYNADRKKARANLAYALGIEITPTEGDDG